jgi:hypothetical protein
MSNPLQYVPQAQRLAQTGAEGFGQVAQRPLMRQIGTTLGGLNSIGALRSGAVPVAAQDIAETYGNQVGGYAKMAAGESLGAGLAANEQDLLKQQLDQQRKSQLLGAIGGALGFAANKIFPAKAAVSAATGG